MASSSKQSETRDMLSLIPLPKYSPGPQPSLFGWALQVEAILVRSDKDEQVKIAFLLNAIPAEILTKVFRKENVINLIWQGGWITVLRVLREYFKDPDTEIEYYNSLQSPTKSVPL